MFLYIVGNTKLCTNCGKLIKIKSKTCPPKYCNDCADKIKNEQNKMYYHLANDSTFK